MSENPYHSPDNASISTSHDDSTQLVSPDLFDVRLPMYIVLAITCIAAVFSLAAFGFQLLVRDPMTGILLSETRFGWLHLGAHLIRGIGLAAFALIIYCQIRAIGKMRPLSHADLNVVFRRNKYLWWTFAALLVVLVAYAAGITAYIQYVPSRMSDLQGLSAIDP